MRKNNFLRLITTKQKKFCHRRITFYMNKRSTNHCEYRVLGLFLSVVGITIVENVVTNDNALTLKRFTGSTYIY